MKQLDSSSRQDQTSLLPLLDYRSLFLSPEKLVCFSNLAGCSAGWLASRLPLWLPLCELRDAVVAVAVWLLLLWCLCKCACVMNGMVVIVLVAVLALTGIGGGDSVAMEMANVTS